MSSPTQRRTSVLFDVEAAEKYLRETLTNQINCTIKGSDCVTVYPILKETLKKEGGVIKTQIMDVEDADAKGKPSTIRKILLIPIILILTPIWGPGYILNSAGYVDISLRVDAILFTTAALITSPIWLSIYLIIKIANLLKSDMFLEIIQNKVIQT